MAALFEANTQKDIDKFCSGEIKDGAVIERVTVERALEMLSAWKSPVKVKK